MEQHEMTLVVGDWSRDGHEMTEDFIYTVNRTPLEVEKAYSLGKEIVGVDITKECEEYEDNEIRGEVWEKLTKAGFAMQGPDDEGFYPAQFAEVWMFIASRGEPFLEYALVKGSYHNIGGYGLFWR